MPYVPYAWQDKSGVEGLKANKSKRLNVIGLLNRNNDLESYIFENKITSEIVIKFLDNYANKIPKSSFVKRILREKKLTLGDNKLANVE